MTDRIDETDKPGPKKIDPQVWENFGPPKTHKPEPVMCWAAVEYGQLHHRRLFSRKSDAKEWIEAMGFATDYPIRVIPVRIVPEVE